jgi:glycosyltransferase involved in cell wall biosynthesis
MPDGSVEVIVVGNGIRARTPIDLGEASASCNIRVLHVADAQANVARNAGLEAARGEYVRFLDDDDFLDPAGATSQYSAIRAAGADVCTGAVRFVNADGQEFDRYSPLPGDDLVAELLWQRPSTLPVANVFRREFLRGLRWDPARTYLQDVDWMHSLARRGEIHWTRIDDTVGAWCHHSGARTSVDYARRSRHRAITMAAQIIHGTIDKLESMGRLGFGRRKAAAKALWDYAHQGFCYSPREWHPVARKARSLDAQSRPSARYFNSWPIGLMDPVVVEWLLFPVRALGRGLMK